MTKVTIAYNPVTQQVEPFPKPQPAETDCLDEIIELLDLIEQSALDDISLICETRCVRRDECDEEIQLLKTRVERIKKLLAIKR